MINSDLVQKDGDKNKVYLSQANKFILFYLIKMKKKKKKLEKTNNSYFK